MKFVTRKSDELVDMMVNSSSYLELAEVQLRRKTGSSLKLETTTIPMFLRGEEIKIKAAKALALRIKRHYSQEVMSYFFKQNRKLAEAFCEQFLNLEKVPPTQGFLPLV